MIYVKVSNITHKFDPNGKGFDCWLNNKLLKAKEFLVFRFEDLPPNWEDMQKILSFEFVNSIEKSTSVGAIELKELLKDALKEIKSEEIKSEVNKTADIQDLIRDVAKEIAQNLSVSTGISLTQANSSVSKAVQTFIPEIESLETLSIPVDTEKSKGSSIANIKERLAKSKKIGG